MHVSMYKSEGNPSQKKKTVKANANKMNG